MSAAQGKIFNNTRQFSTITVAGVVLCSVLFASFIDGSSIGWQVVVALIALAVGIPHGALDHLVTLPRASVARMTFFIAIYVAIAVAAVWAILEWNVIGFAGVVIMSALHFGIGDAAFISERDRASGVSVSPRISQVLYALSAGSLPVVVPLTNDQSTRALAAVNEDLVSWHGGWNEELLVAVTVLTSVALLALAITKRWRDCVDLVVLAALAFLTPPLVAFAAYFGLWHAMRHTARLTLNLKSSQNSIASNEAGRAFRQAVIPGIPALVGTFVIALLIGFQTPGKLSDEFLWLSLVVVWALTVPHMMVTARLDKAALR
ncbi:MAG: Brp/Blh family beta-carotene 15,15'-dioxygenase [Candidatus Nanopelagicaceae bacterium]